MNSEENKFPFKEQKDGKFLIRTFSKELKNEELVWHRDAEDRIIIPLHESDWKIQLDDELPKSLNLNEPILIESEQFHRLIKGNGNLEIKIYKLNLNEVDNLKEIISDSLQIFLEERGKDSRTKKGIKVPGKYLTSKSPKKRAQMKKEIDKFAKKHHSDPKAYTKQWEADKGEKTKTSSSTKTYHKMYSENLDTLNDKKYKIKEKLKQSFNKFKEIALREKNETKEAFNICKKILSKKEISEKEIKFLKEQTKDIAKIVAIMAMGSISMLIPITLEKILNKKYGISIMPNSHNKIDESKNISDNTKKALENKSEKTGIPYYILKQVHDKGMAAWRTGHKPGVSQNQWAMGRVNSFITGEGKARQSDESLWKKAQKSLNKKK
jgi:ribosomal protein L19